MDFGARPLTLFFYGQILLGPWDLVARPVIPALELEQVIEVRSLDLPDLTYRSDQPGFKELVSKKPTHQSQIFYFYKTMLLKTVR